MCSMLIMGGLGICPLKDRCSEIESEGISESKNYTTYINHEVKSQKSSLAINILLAVAWKHGYIATEHRGEIVIIFRVAI